MYCISTTIKKKWMEQILSGAKTSELKDDTMFWYDRLNKARLKLHRDAEQVHINFLCGRKSYRFAVTNIDYFHNHFLVIDGKECASYWEIHLGEQLRSHEPCAEATASPHGM